jgi:hypothetical protein
LGFDLCRIPKLREQKMRKLARISFWVLGGLLTWTPPTARATAPNFTVTTLVDENDGPGVGTGDSLREEILSANAQGTGPITINFAVTGTIVLTQGPLPAPTVELVFNGPGAALLTVDANPACARTAINNRVMDPIDGGVVVTFIGMNFEHGFAQGGDGGDSSGGSGAGGAAAGMGGAFFINNADVTFDSCGFNSNSAQGGAGGDGVVVTIRGSSGGAGGGGGAGADGANSSGNNGGAGGDGGPLGGVGGAGGIAPGGAGGDASAQDGAGGGGAASDGVSGAPGGDGGFGGGGGGGGIDAPGGIGGDGGFGGGGGGAAGTNGGSQPAGDPGLGGMFGGDGGDAIDSDGTGGGGGGGGAGLGGAIFVRAGSLTLLNSSFDNNTASGGPGGIGISSTRDDGNPGQGKGGAVFVSLGATLAGAGNAFSNNSATDDLGISGDDDNVFNNGIPLAVELESFGATARTRFNARVTVEWVTSAEIDLIGFNVFRAERDPANRSAWTLSGEPLNPQLIPGRGTPSRGARYTFLDEERSMAQERAYFLIDIDTSGRETIHGPAFARILDSAQVQAEVEVLSADEGREPAKPWRGGSPR